MLKNRRLKAELASMRRRFEALFAHSPDMIFFLDPQGRIFEANTKAEPLLRYPRETLFTKNYLDMVLEDDIAEAQQHFARVLAGGVERFETRLKDVDGVPGYFEIFAFPIIEKSAVVGVFGFARDIRKQKALEAQLHEMAYHDYLTGLPNQRALLEHVDAALARDEPVTLLMIDIDRFKAVNDARGHQAGDALLIEVARRLEADRPAHVRLFRYGGDEFIAVMRTDEPHAALDLATALQAKFEEPFEVDEHRLRMTVSIGIAMSPDDGGTLDELLIKADNAMYFSKRHGRNTTMLYGQINEDDEARSTHLEIELRSALRAGQIYAVYQPQVRLATGGVFGVEALMRWRHPVLGEIGPNEFIPIAEDSGLIVELGSWMLQHVFEQSVRWSEASFGPVRVSVNLSMHQFSHGELLATVHHLLRRTGADPRNIVLEITESVSAEPEVVTSQLRELRRLGFQLAIDDFGTGYSSMRRLIDYPLDFLKIDRSFIINIHTGRTDRALVSAVTAFAHGIGLRVVAEGVENEDQLQVLRECHADIAQGYYFAKPLSLEAVETWLAEQV